MTQDIKPVSDMTESDKTTKHEEKPETNKKLKEDEKQDFQQEKQTNVKVVNPKSPHEHEIPRRTNTGTIETLTQKRAKDSPGGGHSAGTEQKPQASVAMSSQAQPADGCTRADQSLSPETQDPRAPHTPTEARPSSCEEEKQEADKMFKKIDKKQDFQQEAKQPDVTEVVNHQNTPELEIPRRTNTHTIVATTQTRAEERPGWRHPAGTEQKPQESVAMSSQAQPAADCTRADRPLSPETQDPRAPHTPTGAYQSQGGQAQPSSCQLHEEKQEADKKVKEDEKQDFQQEVKQPSIKERTKQFEENQQSPPDHDTPRKTTTGKIKTPTQMRAKDSPRGGHPPDTEQKPHRSVVMSSQAQLADSCTRADRRLSPETQDPRAPHNPTGARQSQGVQARSSSCQLEKKHAAEEKLKEEHHHLQKKHAEISNMKKEPETGKHKTHPNSKNISFQEQNKSSSANHSSVRGDIILDKVDKLGQYICLKNTSSENKLMGDWEVKLQVNETQPVTYRVEKNFTLKAGERLTLKRVGAMSPYPDDAEMGWMGMTDWEIGDDLKISLISNTGEEHRLK